MPDTKPPNAPLNTTGIPTVNAYVEFTVIKLVVAVVAVTA
jgi:hypothetical protein